MVAVAVVAVGWGVAVAGSEEVTETAGGVDSGLAVWGAVAGSEDGAEVVGWEAVGLEAVAGFWTPPSLVSGLPVSRQ